MRNNLFIVQLLNMCKMDDNIPVLNNKIVFMIENGNDNFRCICALLDENHKLIDKSYLLYDNSENKNFWGIPQTLDGYAMGPLCPNDGEEMQFWKEDFFKMQFFNLKLDALSTSISKVVFFVYQEYNDDFSIPDLSVSLFYNVIESDPLGKITVIEETPFYKDFPIYGLHSEKKFPNYIIGVLQRCSESWQYKSIFKGLDNIDLEKELKSYL